MFILEKPFVSEYMVDTIVQNDWPVLDNQVIGEVDIEEDAFNLWSFKKAVEYYQKQEFPLIYSNSEHGINWVLDNLPHSNLSSYIKLFKDKAAFRDLLKDLYPNFYYKVVDYTHLKSLKIQDLKFPLILKPTVGFLSLGVHAINNFEDWKQTLESLSKEIKYAETLYPKDVVDSSKFIIEEMINGQEYAIDAYYDRNGDAIILNIFEHPLNSQKDVRDRIYITSAEIMIRHMAKFAQLLRTIGELRNVRNLPVHVEVKVDNNGEITPIEINPMRFAGWCTTDIAKYAWNIDVYECFHNHTKPDWNEILSKSGPEIYYFSIIEVPEKYKNDKNKSFDYNSFLTNFSNILELRRIDARENPLFGIVFGSTKDMNEIHHILSLDVNKYTKS